MIFELLQPTRDGAAGDAARRIGRWIGPALSAPDGSTSAAFTLALGTTIATTRARSTLAVVGAIGPGATVTLPEWEASLGMQLGEGSSDASRQAAITTRWRAANAGPSPAEVRATARSVDPTATIHEVSILRVIGTDPTAHMRIVVLLADAVRADSAACARLAGALAIELPAHVTWSLGRGTSPVLAHFRTNRMRSLVDRDVLDT